MAHRWRSPLVTAAVVLILPKRYTAHAVFVPESQSGGLDLPSGLAGLASGFGVPVPGGGHGSPGFYSDVIGSRTLRDQVLLSRLPDPRTASPDDSAQLIDILEVDGESLPERLHDGRKVIEAMVTVRYNRETSVVNLGAETLYPSLSADLANHYLALLNRFNLETRQTSAGERRRFVEERLGEAQAELRAAEEELKTFLERNRLFERSPDLRFQYERLQRQVTIKQEVFTTLRRSYEEARIQEVNDTPLITVIDRALPPTEKSSPRRGVAVTMAFLLGGVLGVAGALGRDYVARARRRDRDGSRRPYT